MPPCVAMDVGKGCRMDKQAVVVDVAVVCVIEFDFEFVFVFVFDISQSQQPHNTHRL